MADLPEECCAKCRFSDFLYELSDLPAALHDLYQCRRFPPTFVRSRPNDDEGGEPEVAMTPSVEDIYTFSFWRHPRVTSIDWCGEFQRKAQS